ncbi:MAG TPA: thioesterase domain-containing protein [Leptolyngbyaceae cyanobacterium]
MEQLLAYLDSLNVKLWVEGDRLCYKAPLGVISLEGLEKLQKYKTQIIPFLQKDRQKFNLVQEKDRSWSPLVGIQTAGVKPPFFCVHPLSGNILELLELAHYLGTDRPFYGLAASGVDGKREPLKTIEDMAACYIQAIFAVQPSGLYFLGGYSLGGRIAFEMAQQLQQQGHQVALLAILDIPALLPRLNITLANHHGHWTKLLSNLTQKRFGKNLPIDNEQLQKLDPQQQLDYLLEILKAANSISSDSEQQMIRRILQVWRCHFEAGVTYKPKVYPGKITLFQATQEDPLDTEVFAKRVKEYALGWSELTTEPIEIHYVPGYHSTILKDPHCLVLADKLKSCLELARVS